MKEQFENPIPRKLKNLLMHKPPHQLEKLIL